MAQKDASVRQTPLLIPEDWQRSNNIGFVRLLLAILVIFSHAFTNLTGDRNTEPAYAWFGGYTSFGRLAVFGFFAISGLLISQSWINRPNLKIFAKRRFLRIWPGFVAASIVVLIFIVPFGTNRLLAYFASLCSIRIVFRHLVDAALLRPTSSMFGFETNPMPSVINGSMWTILYEMAWYGVVAVFGLCGLIGRRAPTLTLTACVVLLDALIELIYPRLGGAHAAGMTLASWSGLGRAFAVGMLALTYRHKIPKHPALLAAALLSFIPAHYFPKLLVLVLPTSFVYVLFWFCFSSGIKLNSIGTKNDLSYGFYLYAFPIEQLLVYRLHWLHSPVLLFVLATAATAPFALFSWFCVERPAKGKRDRDRERDRDRDRDKG